MEWSGRTDLSSASLGRNHASREALREANQAVLARSCLPEFMPIPSTLVTIVVVEHAISFRVSHLQHFIVSRSSFLSSHRSAPPQVCSSEPSPMTFFGRRHHQKIPHRVLVRGR
jgi:hypothetical protein